MANDLTLEQVQVAAPKERRVLFTQDIIDKVNQVSSDPTVRQAVKENFISYLHVLRDTFCSVEDYLNAVKYCSLKMMGLSNIDAYSRVFPDRIANMKAKAMPQKDIASIVSAFGRTKAVVKIMEQAAIPAWLLHQDAFNKAVAVQVELMTTAKSERVRAMAADSILNKLGRPDNVPTINIDMRNNVAETNGIDDLKNMITKLAKTQKDLIEKGAFSTKQVAEAEIIDVEEAN